MTMQSEPHGHGWANSLGLQMTAATIAIVALVLIAWFYVF